MRKEYPRPEIERKKWLNLNGEWAFEYNFDASKVEEFLGKDLTEKIQVPYCPECKLSGHEIRDKIIKNCFYKRTFDVSKNGERKILNFEAVFYTAHVYVNGVKVGVHNGGHTPFSFDVTDYVVDGTNTLAVYCESDVSNTKQPSGKQNATLDRAFVFYTRCSGIWQTVWMESVPKCRLERVMIDTDLSGKVDFKINCTEEFDSVNVRIFDGIKKIIDTNCTASGKQATLTVNIKNPKLWNVGKPNLYTVKYTVKKGDQVDNVKGYFGIRTTEVKYGEFLINGKKVLQRLVLDQGYYVDGLYTPKNDAELKKDIILAKSVGFNGARLHQKVFERRFLYYADKMGYIVWGEYPSWGFDHSMDDAIDYYYPEWKEAVLRDYNHPSIICWCPLNENWDFNGKHQNDNFVAELYDKTKALDKTRPCIDVSWNYHVKTDVYDIHDYTSNVEEFDQKLGKLEKGKIYDSMEEKYQKCYCGQPFMVSEYGGIKWTYDETAVGYGDTPKSVEEFCDRYIGLLNVLLKNERISGICYTQLYDVEQEQNGLYYFNRTPKFKPSVMAKLGKAMKEKSNYED